MGVLLEGMNKEKGTIFFPPTFTIIRELGLHFFWKVTLFSLEREIKIKTYTNFKEMLFSQKKKILLLLFYFLKKIYLIKDQRFYTYFCI